MVGEAVTICEGQMAALFRSLSLLLSPQSSMLCLVGLLLPASCPPCGRGNSSSCPCIRQQAGMQGWASGLLLASGVLSLSVITSCRGRWRQAFLAQIHYLLYRKGDGSWLRKWEEAAAQGSSADFRTQHPGELRGRKRGPEVVVVVSTPKLGSS